MNTIDDRLREAAKDVQDAFATARRNTLPRTHRTLTPATAVAAGVLVVFLIGLPAVLLGGATDGVSGAAPAQPATTSVPVTTPETTGPADDGTIPIVVLDYWALDGTLESVSGEEGWLCPAQSDVGYTSVVSNADMPVALKASVTGLEPVEIFNRYNGPVCRQPHTLVLLTSTDNETPGSVVAAGMTVWPQVTRFGDVCVDDAEGCVQFDGGPVDELTVNGNPARLQLHSDPGRFNVWWVDASGTPMYAEASGLDREQVLKLVGSMTVNPVTRRAVVDTDALGSLEVISEQASVGVWESGYWRHVIYNINGSDVSIDTSRHAAFDPIAQFARFVGLFSLVEVHETPAVWGPDNGGFLTFTSAEGVRVSVEGATSVEEAIVIAEQLSYSTDGT